MPLGELVGRPNVQDRDRAVRHPTLELLEPDRLEIVARAKVFRHHLPGPGGVALRHDPQGGQKVEHVDRSQSVDDLLSAPLRVHQSRMAQGLKMLRRIGEAQVRLGRKGLDRLLALSEVLKEVEAVRIAKRPGYRGEGREQLALRA